MKKYTFTLRAIVEEKVEIEAENQDEALVLFDKEHGSKINLANADFGPVSGHVDDVDREEGENIYNVAVTTRATANIKIHSRSADEAIEETRALIDNGGVIDATYTEFSEEPETITAVNEDDENDCETLVL